MNSPTYHNDIEQGTPEWLQIRLGILTASTMKQIITPSRKPARNEKSRALAWELAAQRITQHIEPTFETSAMLRGHRDEVFARDLYSEKYAPATECGFITREFDGIKIGYSPDGLVGDAGLIEVKSRDQKYQLQTIVSDEVPEEYLAQIQTGLLITGREWLDFISWCGGMPMFVKRVYPDPAFHATIINAAAEFEIDVQSIVASYELNSLPFHATARYEEASMDII